MWNIDLPHWYEFVLRALVVYFFLLVLLRFTGKRQVGQLAPFDLVLLLVLSNAVQNSMNGGDNSVTGGMILAATLVAINSFIGWLAFRSKRVEALIADFARTQDDGRVPTPRYDFNQLRSALGLPARKPHDVGARKDRSQR